MTLPIAITLAVLLIVGLVFQRALRRRLGIPARAWDLYSEVLVCERDGAGGVSAIVYAGEESGEASSFDCLRRWERGRGIVWERKRTCQARGLAVLGDVIFMLADDEVRGIGAKDGHVRFGVALPSRSSSWPVIRDGSVLYFCDAGHWLEIDRSGQVLKRGQAMTGDEADGLRELGSERTSKVRELESEELERQLGSLQAYFAKHGPVGPLTAYWILDAGGVTTMLSRQERGANTWFVHLIRFDSRQLCELKREELGELVTYHGIHVDKSNVNGVLCVRMTGMRESVSRRDNAVTCLIDPHSGELLARLAHEGCWIRDANAQLPVRL